MRLGKLNINKMLRKLTAKQFAEWEEYARIDPLDASRADYRAALIAQTMANVWRGSSQPAHPINDFLLRFADESTALQAQAKPVEQTWQQKKQIAYAIATAFSKPAVDMKPGLTR